MALLDWWLDDIRTVMRFAPKEGYEHRSDSGLSRARAAFDARGMTKASRDAATMAPEEIEKAYPKRTSSRAEALDTTTFEDLEAQRLAALAFRWKTLLLWLPLVIGFTALFTPLASQSLMFGALAALLVFTGAHLGVFLFQRSGKVRILSVLADKLGLIYDPDGPDSDAVKPFEQNLLFGSSAYYLAGKEDLFRGAIRDVAVYFFEAHMRTGEMGFTVFNGLCIRFDFPKRFVGMTRILADRGAANTLRKLEGFERVKLEDSRFEKTFEVYATDQVESRYLLTPTFMERLSAVGDVFSKSSKMRAAFANESLFVTVNLKRSWRTRIRLGKMAMFEIDDLRTPVKEQNLVQRFETQLQAFVELVDVLKLDAETRI